MSEKENTNPFQVTETNLNENDIGKSLGLSKEKSNQLFEKAKHVIVNNCVCLPDEKEGSQGSHVSNLVELTKDCQSVNEVAYVIFIYTKMHDTLTSVSL